MEELMVVWWWLDGLLHGRMVGLGFGSARLRARILQGFE